MNRAFDRHPPRLSALAPIILVPVAFVTTHADERIRNRGEETMRRMVMLLAAVAGLTAMIGCAAMKEAEERRQAEIAAAREATYDVPRDEVRHALINTLLHLEYPIERQNDELGIYETNWTSRSMYGASHTVRVVAMISATRPYKLDIRADIRSQEAIEPKVFEDEVYQNVHAQLTGE
jgi:hypothetical protein